MSRGVHIWRRSDPQLPPSILIEKNNVDGSLLLQNGAILALDSDATDVEKQSYSKAFDAYGVMGVLRITKDESLLVSVTGVLSVGQLHGVDLLKVTNCEFVPLKTIGAAEYTDPRVGDLQRLLSSGMFYFSSSASYDLTSCSQRKALGKGSDPRFFWNRSLHFMFDRFGIDTEKWLIKCTAGSILVRTVYVGHRTGRVALLSRLSCERVGTRFNVRGANHLGRVANFVETEQLIVFDDRQSSLVQVRGSIPLFWEQPGVQVGSHKVKLRAFEASAPAYRRHMMCLRSIYGQAVICNLLGHKEGERVLGDAFKKQHTNTGMDSLIETIHFDYHAQMKTSKEAVEVLRKKLTPAIQNFGFFQSNDGRVCRTQSGVLRTNCLDCLDRTNCVQTLVGLQAVREQVASLELDAGKVNVTQRLEDLLKELWQKNGDQCSTIYAGTGALDGKSMFKDASRSIARTIQNNLMDGSKQESFDLFLIGTAFDQRLFDTACNLLPPTVVQQYADAVSQVVERSSEVTSDNPISIFVGTWNVNGGKNIHNVAFRGESDLSHWIFPQGHLVAVNDLDEAPDIVAIGVEELVDLNATNMVKTSSTNQRLWCESIRKTLLEKAPYILVACEQLVGVGLFLFVRPRLASSMKDFAVASVKTGMGGATGNKGSVAFRMVVHSTSFCFVCSHFAAGQNEVRDRNEDYSTTLRKIRFPQGRDIDSHDVVFWFGDFNYRINLTGDEVKRAIAAGTLEQLVPNDQLTQQKAQGMTFVDFDEGPLRFAPTYKYDTFSDDFDTSEKCRAPAWTDRVLWRERRKNTDTRLMRYDRAELKTSDHRPVGALFSVNSYRVHSEKCPALVEDVVACMGPPDGTIICSVEGRHRFPHSLFSVISEKLRELHARILASKYEEAELWIVLESGESALAALSMDGIPCSGGSEHLSVRLRSPLWSDSLSFATTELDQLDMASPQDEIVVVPTINDFEFDGLDDDELCSSLSTTALHSSMTPPPDRPRPPSVKSEPAVNAAMSADGRRSPFFAAAPMMPSRASAVDMTSPRVWEQQQAPPLCGQAPPNPPPSVPTRQAPPPPPPRPQLPVIPPRPRGL